MSSGCQYTDPETGLIYLRARYYDPATAQFMSRDLAVAMTGSAYGYVDNNPLNGTDPTGLFCLVHNSKGGCLGSGVLQQAQKPISMLGVVAAGVSAFAADISAACTPELDLPCVGVPR